MRAQGTDPQRRGLVARAVIMTVLAALALAAPALHWFVSNFEVTF
jgi:hypothetical protein